MKRVVVTGMGAITPIGLNTEEFWHNLKEGNTGFAEITQFDTADFKVKVAASVKGFEGKNCFASMLLQLPKKRWSNPA